MFPKVLKYDFMFSAKTFAALAAILLAIAVIMRLTMPMFTDVDDPFALARIQEMIMMVMLVGVGIASITQIFQFFNRNFFGASGYLTLTLPVGRLPLILSKVVVAIVWFNFMMLATAAAMFILLDTASHNVHGATLLSRINVSHVVMMIEVNLLAIVAMVTLFFSLTLARSVVGGKRTHGVIAGVIGGGFMALYFWLTTLLQRRGFAEQIHEIELITGETVAMTTITRQAGLRYGRIPLCEYRDWLYLDIFHMGMAIVMTAALVAAIYYMLKRLVALR